MVDIPDTVHKEIKKLIPCAIFSDIVCFVFYDNHPKDDKKIDIAICTKGGELKELFQRDIRCSINLNCVIETPSELRILRNEKVQLFYLLVTKNELYIISSNNTLQVFKKLTNIDRCDVNDAACSGDISLRVFRKDDAVPLVFDSNFESLDNQSMVPSPQNNDSPEILNQLKRKLIEAKYTAKCNKEFYAQCLNLHHKISLLSYQQLQPASPGSIFNNDLKKNSRAFKFQRLKPWVKVCNQKILVMINAVVESEKSIEDVQMLLINTHMPSIVYKTKLFIKTVTSSHWKETKTLKQNQECAIVAVVNLEEFKLNFISRIEISSTIFCKISGQEYLQPFEDVVLSSLESMRDEFDILSSCTENKDITILAVLASTEKTELCLRHITDNNEVKISILELFCIHLQMEIVEGTNNVIVYRKSPYHALNGILLIFHESDSNTAFPVSIHTRSPCQIMDFYRFVYDAVPAEIIVTTPTLKITAFIDDYSHDVEENQNTTEVFYRNYATSYLSRSAKILQYLNNATIKMSESKNPIVQNKVGSHVDLFASGAFNFKEFKQILEEDAKKEIDSLLNPDDVDYNTESDDVMIID